MSTPQQHFDLARQWQEEFDNTLQEIGSRAMQPTLGQSCNDYIRESMRTIKRTFLPQTHPLYKIQMRRLDASAIGPVWENLKKAAREEANNPMTVPEGELRMITTINPANGQKMNRFVGRDCFVKWMGRPGRRVVKFRELVDPQGRSFR